MDELILLRDNLLNWYSEACRPLPWRRDREPYHVWLSEIMCQQTRVEAVKAYYLRFLEALPDIPALAVCEEDRLLKLWEGLGYYSRARNLQKAARVICSEHGGRFPITYEAVRALPGIGDYTAAAICSICFGLPAPVVDGNVLRVWSRFFGDRSDIRLPETKKNVRSGLLPLFDGVEPGQLNQALMELGALICRPNGEPDCGACPLREKCTSVDGLWQELPVKSAAKPRRTEEKTVFLLRCGEKFAIRKRPKTGLLAGLWEFPHQPGILEAQEALNAAAEWGCEPDGIARSTEKEHVFTHITWQMRGYHIQCNAMPETFRWVAESELREAYSLPTAFRQFMDHITTES